MFLGVVDVASGEAQEVTPQVEAVLLSWIPDRAWWAQKVVALLWMVPLTFVCVVPLHDKRLMCRQWSTMCLPCL